MTSLFSSEGNYVPVTVIEVGPCVVTQIKTEAIDGYNALQLGFGEKKRNRINKPLQGHLEKSKEGGFAYLREFSVENRQITSLVKASPWIFFRLASV
ncbi:MAG: hypothetical protein ACE5DO_06975 [Desulfobacterales bacterium]